MEKPASNPGRPVVWDTMGPQGLRCLALPSKDMVVLPQNPLHPLVDHLRLNGAAPQDALSSPFFDRSVENTLPMPVGIAVIVSSHTNANGLAVDLSQGILIDLCQGKTAAINLSPLMLRRSDWLLDDFVETAQAKPVYQISLYLISCTNFNLWFCWFPHSAMSCPKYSPPSFANRSAWI